MPEAPSLGDTDVHVWSASLDRPPVPLTELRRALSPDERERAARFAFDERRRRFEAAHGLMRRVLGAYTGRPPHELEFSVEPGGKPSLRGTDTATTRVDFNLSDSADHFLLAVTRGAPVGADVERLRPVRDLTAIARRFFAPSEAERLISLPPNARERAFFECWTRKEAFVKAVGGGLQIPLDSFEVDFGPTRSAGLLTVDGSETEAARWSLWGFDASGGDAIAAVAVRRTGWSLHLVMWDDHPVARRIA